jgi:selenide,water dikinase
VLQQLPRSSDPNVLVDASTLDDAGVYRLGPGLAMVQTLDFFTPIVDDAEDFGAAAAANALSDVYAMGGRPITALNILCFPEDRLPTSVMSAILRGSAKILAETGVALLGGHTVADAELKFGLSVTGLVDPDKVWTNAGARVGDALVLTKPIGTGVLATALKRGKLSPATLRALTASLHALNRDAAAAAAAFEIHACTDVTGCGLAGHAYEMALASGVGLEFELAAVPLLPDAEHWVGRKLKTKGDRLNREYIQQRYQTVGEVSPARLDLAFDPQTSGGLLLAVAPAQADELVRALRSTPGARESARVGRVIDAERPELIFR